MSDTRHPLPAGVPAAILAAVLFGASTPFAKLLLGQLPPVFLAGLLYLGSGIGLSILRVTRRQWGNQRRRTNDQRPTTDDQRPTTNDQRPTTDDQRPTNNEQRTTNAAGARSPSEASLTRADFPWLAGAVCCGGVVGPVLLLVGLQTTPGSSASLLLNLEGVFTALLAWFAFRENVDRRIALGMAAIVAGGILLSWQGRPETGLPWGALAILGACACWGLDNNLTQKVSAGDPVQVAAIKGLVAGSVNLGLAYLLGQTNVAGSGNLAGAGTEEAFGHAVLVVGASGVIGFLGYGLSLSLFVLALRHIGTARTGAYFSLAPFVGAVVSLIVLREPIGPLFLVAAALMAFGIWLHLTERHEHEHFHPELAHEHRHVHDEHHQHEHEPGIDPREPHSHWHVHPPMRHRHPHFPDIHHRHGHSQ
jgi:drug/metabolite transporter (DMT)-like permease